MKNASNVRHIFSISLLVVSLVFLPGCAPFDWLKKQFGSDETVIAGSGAGEMALEQAGEDNVLISMNGKPVVTLAMLEENYQQVIAEQPQLAQLEGPIKQSLVESLLRQELVNAFVDENKIKETATYQKDRDTMAKHCEKILNVKYFREAHPVVVQDDEIKKYYEDKKDMFPDLVLERGGVDTKVVSFEKEVDAKAFLAKAKATPKDFEKLAQVHKNTYRDYKFVNAQSPEVDPAIKNAVLETKTFPAIQLVKSANNHFWVVDAVSKKDSKYRPFDDQIKAGIRMYMVQEREAKAMEEEMAKLKEKYHVVVNAAALNTTAQTQVNLEEAFGLAAQDQIAQAQAPAGQATNNTATVA